MLERETVDGIWQVRLHYRGAARGVQAGFLAVWLCGWAVGECVAAGRLIAWLHGPQALARLADELRHLRLAGAHGGSAGYAFLAVWLAFWTLGGFFACCQLWRLMFGAEVVRWDSEHIESGTAFGVVGRANRTAFSEIRGFRLGTRTLFADTARGTVLLATAGSPAERAELRDALLEAWRATGGTEGGAAGGPPQAPNGWREDRDNSGALVLVSDLREHRGFVAGLALVSAIPAGIAGVLAWRGIGMAFPAIFFFGVFALLALAVAVWLACSRLELRPREGALEWRQKAFGREWVSDFSPATLRLSRTSDQHDNDFYRLTVSGPGGSKSLSAAVQSPLAALQRARWLASRMNVTIEGLAEAGVDPDRRAG